MNVLDLFSGIGGFSLGLERTGMRTIAFCEIDPYCRAVLNKHWPDVPVWGDIRTLTWANRNTNNKNEHGCAQHDETGHRMPEPGGIDVICGGFPCQDISLAGKGAGLAGDRSGLWSEYARIIGEVRPRYVIVENVAALLGRGLERVLGDLAALGFDAEWHCIPASAVGAPHRRDRVWIIAYAKSIGFGQGRQGRSDCDCEGETEQALANSGVANVEGQWLASGIQKERGSFGSSSWWQSEPDVGRVAHGVPFELDLVREIENGNCNCQETEPEAEVVIWRLLRAMWECASLAETSSDLYRKRLYDLVPELPQGNPYSFWHLGAWIKEDKELCRLWECFYSAPFHEAQNLQQRMLERIRTKKRPQALGSRVDRLRALGNAVVPQIPEIIGRAIMRMAQ